VDTLITNCVEDCKRHPREGHPELETREFYFKNIKDLLPIVSPSEPGVVVWQFVGKQYMNGEEFDEYIAKTNEEIK